MMLKAIALTLALLLVATAAGAGGQTLTADGFTAQGEPSPPATHDRDVLVHDGSFEFGECGLGSAWTCTSNTTCSWILDPTAVWGYPAFDGVNVAWLGGFCGTPNSNSFCQDVVIGGSWGFLDWYWMGYVNSGCGTITVTADGVTRWSHVMELSEHTYGTWLSAEAYWGYIWIGQVGTPVTLCFEWEACPDGASNDNMLIDFVRWDVSGSAAEAVSISTVKALY